MLAYAKWMFDSSSIPVLREVWQYRMKMKLDSTAIAKRKMPQQKFGGRLQGDALFRAVIPFRGLRRDVQNRMEPASGTGRVFWKHQNRTAHYPAG